MKKCMYCGREDTDDATYCGGCGGTQFFFPPTAPVPPVPWDKVAVLENEMEAERLGAELRHRNIPFIMRSYYDSAYDGLFQFAHGWGQIEAAGEYREAILGALKDLRETFSASAGPPGGEASSGIRDA